MSDFICSAAHIKLSCDLKYCLNHGPISIWGMWAMWGQSCPLSFTHLFSTIGQPRILRSVRVAGSPSFGKNCCSFGQLCIIKCLREMGTWRGREAIDSRLGNLPIVSHSRDDGRGRRQSSSSENETTFLYPPPERF